MQPPVRSGVRSGVTPQLLALGRNEPQMWLEKVAAARALQTPALLEILLTWPQKRSFCSEMGVQTPEPVLQPKGESCSED